MIMKKIKIIFLAAVAALSFTACKKDLDKTSRTITIEAGIGPMTKVTTTGAAASFDAGDIISVYAWTGDKTAVPATRVVDGVENTYDGTKWTPASPMLWDDVSTEHYFLGIYPKKAVTNFTADAYTLNPADYEASDLLIAVNTTGLKAGDNPVTLAFDHAMAKLNVNLTFRNQWATAPTVTGVSVTAKKTATVNYLAANPVTATGTADAVALQSIDNATWSGLQVPQSGVNTITIAIGGKDYVFTHTADIPLAKGQYTTVNLIVGRSTIELGSVSISNWTAGTTIDGGEAQTDD